MNRQGDIVAAIKALVDLSRFDFGTAEGRANFDDVLRAQLRTIHDETLRSHAAELLREWRYEVFGQPTRALAVDLIARLEAVEAALGLTPAPRKPAQEITTLRREK